MADKIRVSQAVIVEGKYDKIKLSSIIDAVIIQTDGFRIYKDKEKCALIRALYEKQGLIVLTDSDHAGFQLRRYIKNILGSQLGKDFSEQNLFEQNLFELYIPQISGKESRKQTPGKENLLGVEGIDVELLKNMFLRFNMPNAMNVENPITKQDFYEDGLSGSQNSSKKREAILIKLNLPLYITTNGLLDVINSLITKDEYKKFIKSLN